MKTNNLQKTEFKHKEMKEALFSFISFLFNIKILKEKKIFL